MHSLIIIYNIILYMIIIFSQGVIFIIFQRPHVKRHQSEVGIRLVTISILDFQTFINRIVTINFATEVKNQILWSLMMKHVRRVQHNIRKVRYSGSNPSCLDDMEYTFTLLLFPPQFLLDSGPLQEDGRVYMYDPNAMCMMKFLCSRVTDARVRSPPMRKPDEENSELI